MKPIIKVVLFILSAIFWFFAYVQLNDPDSTLWIAIYAIAAIICILVAFDKLSHTIIISAMVAYLIGAISLWPEQYNGLSLDNGFTPSIEEARESLGLVFCGLVMGLNLFLVLRKRQKIKIRHERKTANS
jgi:uncharacterized membrane protein